MRTHILLAATGLALAAALPAHAADPLGPPPPPPIFVPADAPAPFEGNWYLRGDVGTGIGQNPSLRLEPAPSVASIDYLNESVENSHFVDVGVGYRFNEWFRVDVTGELRGTSGWAVTDRYTNTDGSSGANFHRGHLSSAVIMANAYADLGTWYRVTPFVGAGVGYAWHWTSGGVDSGFHAGPGMAPDPTGGTYSDGKSGSFAWALMAGLGYKVSERLTLEVAYRYMDLGSVKTGNLNCFDTCYRPKMKINDLAFHDVKLGMRWSFGDAPPPPPPMVAPPLVRKY